MNDSRIENALRVLLADMALRRGAKPAATAAMAALDGAPLEECLAMADRLRSEHADALGEACEGPEDVALIRIGFGQR